MRKKKQVYNVTFDVNIMTSMEIQAASFEEALEIARGYREKDIVDFDTDFLDGSIEVIGVWK